MSVVAQHTSARQMGGTVQGYFTVIAPLVAVLAFAVFQLKGWQLAGGFEYPLDDTYIHLAMADGLAHGHYGINASEPSSAASSALWPVLLMPFAPFEIGRYAPLMLNVLFLILAAAIWGRIVAQARLSDRLGLVLATFGPIWLNMYGVAALGMEHSLHAALAMAAVLGLAMFIEDRRLRWWFALALILAPLVRFEGLALSLACAGSVVALGRMRAGLLLGAGALAGPLMFMGFLVSQGLPPLPSSVSAKLLDGTTTRGVFSTFFLNLTSLIGIALLVLSAICLLVPLVARKSHQSGRWMLPVAAGLAGLAHLFAGHIGWGARYEHYIVLTEFATLVLCWGWIVQGQAVRTIWQRSIGAAISLVAFAIGGFWMAQLWTGIVFSPRAIHLQQAQMARFAKFYWRGPVAVNDLGSVSWRNPEYVLDLWGLGSEKALELRQSASASQGWAGPLVRAHHVGLVMIYEGWLSKAIDPDWIKLGELHLSGPTGLVSRANVSFYATTQAAESRLLPELKAFVPTLPEGATFTYAPSFAGQTG